MSKEIEAQLEAALEDTALRTVPQTRNPPAFPPTKKQRAYHRPWASARRMKWLAPLLSVASVAAIVVGTLVVTDNLGNRSGRPLAAGPFVCPRTFAGPAPWVPTMPQHIDGKKRLAPLQAPIDALVCAYSGTDLTNIALSGTRQLSSGLTQLATDLTWLPRKLTGASKICGGVGAGQHTNFLIGLTYSGGTEWVSTADDADNCVDTSNGRFVSPVNIGAQIASSYAAGVWVPAPPPRVRSTDHDPCNTSRTGRLGQEASMIPANPRSILVCEGTLGSTSSSYRSALITQGFQGLVAALNALPTKRSTASCQGDGNQEVFYELLSNYVQGPSVIVTVDPHCAPSIDNHSLQSDDSSSIVPLIQRLIR